MTRERPHAYLIFVELTDCPRPWATAASRAKPHLILLQEIQLIHEHVNK